MNNFTEIHSLDNIEDKNNEIWIYPIGNISDMLILNSILFVFSKKYPDRKFKMVKRSNCLRYFKNNPSIIEFGFPKAGSVVLITDYWNHTDDNEKLNPYQLLARFFSLELPIEEKVFIQYSGTTIKKIEEIIPWKKNNIVIAPFAEFENSEMHPAKWHKIVEKLISDDTLVIQIGKLNDIHIKGTYSLLGISNFSFLLSILKNINFIITSDNYMIHLSNAFNIPAIVLLGNTQKTAQIYKNQHIFNAQIIDSKKCIECQNINYHIYNKFKCPFDNSKNCINSIKEYQISNIVLSFLK